MGHHYAKKYNDKQKEKLINEFLKNKEKDPNFSLIKYVREKGIKENTFRYWLKSKNIIQDKKNDVVRIDTVDDTQIPEYPMPVIRIKTEKAEITIENGMSNDVFDLLRRLILNVN